MGSSTRSGARGVDDARGGTPPAAPSSSGQERLWFLEQLNPGTALYTLPFRFRLRGPLDVEALREAIGAIVARHEVLRTTFATGDDGRPVQVVHGPEPVELPVVEAAADEVESLSEEETARGFDLESGPLLRALLLRVAPDEHVFVLTMHHIVTDGWSMGVFFDELAHVYDALVDGREPSLPELPLQYREHAARERAWLQSDRVESQLAYWRGRLAGMPEVLTLPADRPRPAVPTYRGGQYRFEVPDELAARIRELARDHGASVFMTVLAAFDALVARYTGREDVVVGTLVGNRGEPDVEPLIGFFANTLVLRTSLAGDPSFEELLARVRDVALDAYSNEALPFERLVDELQPQRDLSHAPLVQVLCMMQPLDEVLALSALEVETLPASTHGAEFDLVLIGRDSPRGMHGLLEYNADVFEERTVARLAEHLLALLAGAVEDPGRRVSELPLLTGAELAQLDAWNETTLAVPEPVCVHRMVEERAVRSPEALAVAFEDDELTYAGLNERANRLARRLRALGVERGALVGLCLRRSLDLVVAQLAILKAGAAYVPLDPDYPRQRLAFMLSDSGAAALVTAKGLVETLPEQLPPTVLVDADRAAVDAEEPGDLGVDLGGHDLAYVIYTSGSTGRPKGVAVTHANVASFFAAMDRELDGTDPRAWLAVTSVSFDISVLELLWPLARGLAVVVQGGGVEALDEAVA